MAEATRGEQLLPSLFTRLTDRAPEKTRESRQDRVVNVEKYLEAVKRDLSWLLNTDNHDSVRDLSGYPLVSASVINYGLPALAGGTISNVDSSELERSLRQAILRFEPRLTPATLEVKVVVDKDVGHPNALAFEISGEVWADPIPERLNIRTEVDLETGAYSIPGITNED